MKSKTKNLIPQDKLEALVRVNFGEYAKLDAISELGGGMFNAAYLLTLKNAAPEVGTELVLKVSVSPQAKILTYEKDIMRTEVEVNRKLREKGVPVPRIIAADFSRRHIDCDYFFMTKLNGTSWSDLNSKLTLEDKERLKAKLGSYTAVIHSVTGDRFGYPALGQMYGSWREAFTSMLCDIIGDGQQQKVRLPYQRIIKAVKTKQALLDEIAEPRLVDFDLWAGNVLLVEKDGVYDIEGIIDFERAFYGDPAADFIASMMILGDIECEAAYIRGYTEKSSQPLLFTDHDRARRCMYRLYLALIMAVETYRYGKSYGVFIRGYCWKQIESCLTELNSYDFSVSS
jgi:aminoglycoside phosphotransferase (APT) family kinase protein